RRNRADRQQAFVRPIRPAGALSPAASRPFPHRLVERAAPFIVYCGASRQYFATLSHLPVLRLLRALTCKRIARRPSESGSTARRIQQAGPSFNVSQRSTRRERRAKKGESNVHEREQP